MSVDTPTIFGSILMSQVAVDEDGYPTIFVSILSGEVEGVDVDSMECDEGLPNIQPINPNVRARKLEVNDVAKAKKREDLANGVAPPNKKRSKGKQAIKKKTLKATMIQRWHPDDPHAADSSKGQHTKGKPTKPKAKDDDTKTDSDAQALQVGRKVIKHADALILSAYGSGNAATGRYDIQDKCTLSDGSCKTIGIFGFCEKGEFGGQVWQTLLDKINNAKGKHTKGEIMFLCDKLISDCKSGRPCSSIDAD